jgi:SAM-dependent methyltransferase
LLKENLTPGGAAAAVFLGIFIGIVPIYGFQTLVAVGLALFFKLNKPLTVAGTFINNPLLQPLIVVSSVELGYFLRDGSFRPFHFSALAGAHIKEEILGWVMGSVVLGVLVGGAGAAITAVVVRVKAPANPAVSNPDSSNPGLRDRIRFVNQMFARCDRGDRGFVFWKLRLDRIFGLLAAEDLGSGTVVDLGCGYGMALSFAAFTDNRRRLVGCDLDAHRIAVARQALSALNTDLSVADVRGLSLPPAGLILILDVLQYLPADEQLGFLKRCCSALTPQGKFIFRVHDRQRGLRSAITSAFDRLIFAWGRAGVQPLMLPASAYRTVLEKAGMQVEERRFQNRLPLAHILFIAKKPTAESAT